MFQSIPPDPTAQIIIDTTLNWRDKLFWPKLTVYTNDKSKLIYPREINYLNWKQQTTRLYTSIF